MAQSEIKVSAIRAKQTKVQIIAAIADDTGIPKKEVVSVLDSLGLLAKRHLKSRGSGEFTVPGVGLKLRRVRKPARKARKGINPFTGEATVFKAKPASNAIKATALKSLKEAVA